MEDWVEPETKLICQNLGDVCTKLSPAMVLPSSVLTDRETRQGRSSFVCRFVRISDCEGITFTESGISTPVALTFRVSVFSENGSSASHPYTNMGVVSCTRHSQRLSPRPGARLSGRERLDRR